MHILYLAPLVLVQLASKFKLCRFLLHIMLNISIKLRITGIFFNQSRARKKE